MSIRDGRPARDVILGPELAIHHEPGDQYGEWYVRDTKGLDHARYHVRADAQAFINRAPYGMKCKRRRANGPTPCYCCEGECVGEPLTVAMNEDYCNAADRVAANLASRRNRRFVNRLAIVVALGLAFGAALVMSKRQADVRDPRCDGPARYQAMSEGADCQ